MTNEPATLGHNNPPTELEILQERLQDYKEETDTLNRLSGMEIPAEIQDDDMSGKITDHIKALKNLQSGIDKIHKAEKAPYFECGKQVDSWKNRFKGEIDPLIRKASLPVLAWNKKKEEAEQLRLAELSLKAEEEAVKLAKEAEAHADAGIEDTADELMDMAVREQAKAELVASKIAEVKGRSRGDMSVASNSKTWTGELTSRGVLEIEKLRDYFTDDDINKAIKRAVKAGAREIRGTRIYQQDKLSVR